MKPHDITIGILMGCVAILFGMVPGLLQGLTDRVRDFRGSMAAGLPVSHPPRTARESIQPPIWLAVLGGMLIALSVFAYLST